MPLNKDIKKVLVIGQAAEFDYAGAQACRVLKDAGLDVVLVNSNPATIMTDSALANEIYLEPLTVETVKRIIEKERPDSILAGLGGQTGLTIAMQLAKDGYLEKMGVKLLGTNAEAIDKAEDRQMFRDTMLKIGQPCIPSDIATTVDRAAEIAEEIGYPVILRPAFTLGGAGGGVAYNEQELRVITYNGLMLSPITQVLVEKYIAGWKEIEFEVMRDSAGNAIAICSMENIDPVGVHTGDSIVVAPAMTLSDKEYQMLRSASLDIITELGIEGGCNCQFALDPESFEYAVIEVNPRVSRSSALASKATGFPIAKVTSKIALGYTLDEIRNDITGKTCACFEPTVDYCVVKFPKWPFDKFVSTSRKLGTQMKATGEVMAIAPSFEMAIMKAVRGAEIGLDTLNYNKFPENMDVIEKLHDQDDIRLFTVFKALKEGVSIEEIHSITMIDEWFLAKLKNLADYEKMLTSGDLDEDYYIKGKKLGYKDSTIQKLAGKLPEKTLDAVYKMVDTCGAEFKAETPYFYSTYDTECESREIKRGEKETIILLGSGPIRIGQGIEFDYSSVHCVWTLKELGYEVVIINNNPETVSTDFDTADRLYFEPLNDEDVMNVIKVENPVGVVVAFGGQTAIKLTKFLDESGIKILGTSAEGIDIAEDRERFDALLESFNIKRPQGLTVMNVDEALKAADELGYPVLLRPSYVIGGQNMTIAYNETDVRIYMDIILAQKIENPVLVDQYLMGDELEVDVISDGKDVLIPGVMEHIERAGVHSGDSIAVYPPYNIPDKMLDKVIECSTNLALALGTKGLVNIQYLIFRNELYVIEVNPRASRTIPYISKVTGVPMVELATKVMTGTPLKELGYGTGLYKIPPYFAIKVPVFSFEKLSDINSELGPEMKSTGEVLGIGRTLNEALFKGLVSAGFKVGLQSTYHDKKYNAGVLISVHDKDKPEIVGIAKKFADLGLKIYSTAKTGVGLRAAGIEVETIGDFNDCSAVLDVLETGKIDYIVYTGSTKQATIQNFIKIHRRAVQLSICTLTSLDTANALCDTLASRFTQRNTELVDINNLREEKMQLKFTKMQATGNDDIYFNNFCRVIPSPESLTVNFTDRHFGIGADGVVLLESSDIADAKMVVYNNDGTQTRMAVNSIRCAAKYLYDNGIVPKKNMTIETSSGVMKVKLYTFNGEVRSATVDIGKPDFNPASIPMSIDAENAIGYETEIGGEKLTLNCVSVGNPHCIVFRDDIDSVNINDFGDMIRNSELLPEYINTGVARLIDKNTIKLRCYERAVNGESLSCGASAAACVVVATELGMCKKGEDITVKMPGGDLVITYTDETILVNGDTQKVYEGVVEY